MLNKVILFAVAISLSLTTIAQQTTSDEKIDLRMFWWGSSDRAELTNEALDLFEAKHPNISISRETIGWDGYWQKLGTQVAGGNAPDIMQMDNGFLPEYASRGTLLALDPYIPDIINLEGFDDAIVASGQFDDNHYAVAMGINSQGIIYNENLFQKANLELPDRDWTWDDFSKLANELSESLGNDIYGTEDLAPAKDWFHVFLRQRGIEFYTEDGKLGFSKQDLIDWFSMWANLRESGAAPPPTVVGQGAEDSLLVKGKVAMYSDWSNLFSAYQSYTQDALDLYTYPTGEQGTGQYLQPAVYMSVSSQTEHPEAAAMVINFLINDPEAARILGTNRGIPPSSQIREQLVPDLNPVDAKVFGYINLLGEENLVGSTPASPPPGDGQLYDLFTRTSERIAFGQASIEEAVDRFFSEAEKILSGS